MSEQIDQFFRADGTLVSIPVKSNKKIAVLRHIASELSPDTKYSEKQLNEEKITRAANARDIIAFGKLFFGRIECI